MAPRRKLALEPKADRQVTYTHGATHTSDEIETEAKPVQIAWDERLRLLIECQGISPNFNGLDLADLAIIAESCDILAYPPGSSLMKKNGEANFVAVVLRGLAVVVDKDFKEGQAWFPLARLRPGAIAGEVSLFQGGKRAADVVASIGLVVVQFYFDGSSFFT
eukprot:gene15752-18677_t